MQNNLKYKDTIFRYLFKDVRNFSCLYGHITNKVLKPEEIVPFDTKNLLINKGMKNDVSVLTKDNKLIVLTEHQSTINPNMASRNTLYYFELLRMYIKLNKINLCSRTLVKLPSPEMYVIYNGKEKLKGNTQFLKNSFDINNGFINSKVKIIDINFDRLSSKITSKSKDVFVGYAFFIDKIRMFLNTKLPLELAIEKAKEQCFKQGYLLNYINEKEFLTMALMEYTVEQEIMDRVEAEREQVEKRAEERGKKIGEKIGEKTGKKIGEEIGEKRARIEVAKEMLKSNLPIETIVAFSKLTIKEIQQIQKENNN